MKAAFVGLVRGRDRIEDYSRLIRRNRLLHRNFNKVHAYPVLLFHEGDICRDHQAVLSYLTPNISFVDIGERAFRVPDGLPPEDQDRLGYKHMCRFYAIQIFDYVSSFDYIMRLDDDSFIESRIDEDIFDLMERQSLDYGYVHSERDTHEPTVATLPAFTRQYARDHGVNANCAPEEIDGTYFYTNFYVTRVSFWMRPDVRQYLAAIDDSMGIYRYRWGDHVIHTHALKLFSRPSQWHRFSDFRYSHGSHDWSNYRKRQLPRVLDLRLRNAAKRASRWYLRLLMRRIGSA